LIRRLIGQAARELDFRTKEWHTLENGYHSQLSEKDAEIRHLLLQVELASQSNVEEVNPTLAWCRRHCFADHHRLLVFPRLRPRAS
jgi:hypothetical protein